MNKLIFLLLLLLSPASAAWAGDLRMANQHDTNVVEIAINRNPPIVGDNRIEIRSTKCRGDRLVALSY